MGQTLPGANGDALSGYLLGDIELNGSVIVQYQPWRQESMMKALPNAWRANQRAFQYGFATRWSSTKMSANAAGRVAHRASSPDNPMVVITP